MRRAHGPQHFLSEILGSRAHPARARRRGSRSLLSHEDHDASLRLSRRLAPSPRVSTSNASRRRSARPSMSIRRRRSRGTIGSSRPRWRRSPRAGKAACLLRHEGERQSRRAEDAGRRSAPASTPSRKARCARRSRPASRPASHRLLRGRQERAGAALRGRGRASTRSISRARASSNLLSKVAGQLGKRQEAVFRVNPDIGAGGHAKITTGSSANKFGVSFEEVGAALCARGQSPGRADHGACGPYRQPDPRDRTPSRRPMPRWSRLVGELRGEGHRVERLDLGGGLGIPYDIPKTFDYGPGLIRGLCGDGRPRDQGARCRARLRAGPTHRRQCRYPADAGCCISIRARPSSSSSSTPP